MKPISRTALRNLIPYVRTLITKNVVFTPCIAWVGFSRGDSQWANELRGKGYWELMRDANQFMYSTREKIRKWVFPWRKPHGHEQGEIRINQPLKVYPCINEVLIVVMPSGDVAVEVYRDRVAWGLPIITDVTADVLGLGQGTKEMMAARRDAPHQDQAWEQWSSDPKMLSNFEECLRMSTVITTSWESLVRPLQQFTKFRVEVRYVPDCHMDDEQSVLDFGRNMSAAVIRAMELAAPENRVTPKPPEGTVDATS